jgi:hypothetical protein
MRTAPATGIEGNLFPLWNNTFFKLTLDESMKSPIAQRCVQDATLPLIYGCCCSTQGHHPFSNMLLCLTASSYKMILLHLSQEDSTVEDVIQVAEPSFYRCV